MARQALKPFLEHHGYACDEAEHGVAALAWLDAGHHVDLIISDNQMPVMSGLEFLVKVKATASLGSIPFILYSGNITDAVRRQAQQVGAYAVLSKPYNFLELVEIVTQALVKP